MIYSPPPDSLEEASVAFAPGVFRARLESNVRLDDPLEDAAIAAYTYERRWQDWWSKRRWILLVLMVLPLLLFLWSLAQTVLGNGSGSVWWLALASLVLLLLFLPYYWLAMPRMTAFGRVYRRLMAVPLSSDGTVWCDAAKSVPDFPALRDNFFALHRDSAATGARTQPGKKAKADEITRKKWLIGDLSAMLAPLLDNTPDTISTPFIASPRTACLDRLRLEGLSESLALELAGQSLPYTIPLQQPTAFANLAREVEVYSNPEIISGKSKPKKLLLKKISPQNLTQVTPPDVSAIVTNPVAPPELVNLETALAPIVKAEAEKEGELVQPPFISPSVHRQTALKVGENLGLVRDETQRWEEANIKEKAFLAGQVARVHESKQKLELTYQQIETGLENEIRPAVQQLEVDVEFYQGQISHFYNAQKVVIEGARDGALGKLGRELQELEGYQEERLDEQSLLQSEFKGLSDQRSRLENSTDNRFESLKNQLAQLTGRTYTVPPPPVFRSNLTPDAEVGSMTTEEVLQGLADLRAEARLSTNAVHSALNRYARLRFDPLDDLGQLEQELAEGTKWQATRWLGNIINFRQSGQLLALAGEVSDSVGVYLDAAGDFERLNARWCNLEAAITQLGLASYASRLGEAQQYLVNLADVIGSLHSSLAMAPHSPEMARPATFQSLYDLAAGLQRELEELSGLAGNITRVEERLDQLTGELAELADYIARNKAETERVTEDASERLTEVARRQQSLEDKLAEMKVQRLAIMRGHLDTFHQQRTAILERLDKAAQDVSEAGDTADKMLKKHLGRAERLLEEAYKLQHGLEATIAGIVEEFEQSVVTDRTALRPSELYVPIWFFQFLERPLWKQRALGFATCYYSVTRVGTKPLKPRSLSSLVSFLFGYVPDLRYKLEEEPDLAALLEVQNLDYPAGRVLLVPGALEKLSYEGWITPWLAFLLKRMRPR